MLLGCGGPPGPAERTRVEATAGAWPYILQSPPTERANGLGVVLLHRRDGDVSVWDGFAELLVQQGFAVVMPELPRDWAASSGRPALDGIMADAHQRLGALPTSATHPLAVIGEQEGAALALDWGANRPGMGGMALLSCPLEAGELDSLTRMQGFTQCPVLLVASEGDARSATAAMQLKDAAPAFCEIQLYPGNAHGTDIFALRPEVMTAVADWLRQMLTPKPAGV